MPRRRPAFDHVMRFKEPRDNTGNGVTPGDIAGLAELAPFCADGTRYYTCPYLGATSTSTAWPTGTARMHVFPVHKTITVDRVGMFCGAAVNRSIRFAIYTLDDNLAISALLLEAGTFTGAGAASAFNQVTVSQQLTAGWYGLSFAMFGAGSDTTFSIQGNNQQYGPFGVVSPPPNAATESMTVGWEATGISTTWASNSPAPNQWTIADDNVGSGVWVRRSA